MAHRQRDPEDGPLSSPLSADTDPVPPLRAHTPLTKSTRPSARPSAFGTPRAFRPTSARPEALHDAGEIEPGEFTEPSTFSLHPPKPSRSPSLPPPVLAPTPRASRPIAVPLDTTALPPLPAALAGATHAPRPRALDHPLLSIAAFAIMLSASAGPLMRYLGLFDAAAAVQAQAAKTRADRADVVAGQATIAPAPAVKTGQERRIAQLAELEHKLPKEPQAASQWLMDAASERRAEGDLALAEAMLARALKHDENNAELAFAFAQVRKAQGNLEGAEGWVLKAIRLSPRAQSYHSFYAELLTSLGRPREAARVLRAAKALKR